MILKCFSVSTLMRNLESIRVMDKLPGRTIFAKRGWIGSLLGPVGIWISKTHTGFCIDSLRLWNRSLAEYEAWEVPIPANPKQNCSKKHETFKSIGFSCLLMQNDFLCYLPIFYLVVKTHSILHVKETTRQIRKSFLVVLAVCCQQFTRNKSN